MTDHTHTDDCLAPADELRRADMSPQTVAMLHTLHTGASLMPKEQERTKALVLRKHKGSGQRG